MPEIKKTFLRGRMNKDLDERLVPDGEYRDALNVQVSSSEDSNAGTIQNVLGNRQLKNMTSLIGEVKCVGSVADTENDKLYWFFKGINSNTKQGIIEYDTRDTNAGNINGTLIDSAITPVVIDTAGTALNFTSTQITSIQILDRLLAWTDGVSEPKIIDLDTFETYNTYQTKNYTAQTQIPNTQGIMSNMEEQHLTLIKQKPSSAPIIALTNYISAGAVDTDKIYEEKFIRFGYRWRFTNGQYSAFSPFSEPVFDPRVDASTYFYNIDEGYNERMLNNVQKIVISGLDVPNDAEAIDILYKEAGNNNVYIYKTETGLDPANPPIVQIDNKEESIFSVLPEDQLFRAYDNVPVKAKALDIIANRIVFGNYTTGMNIGNYSPTFTITETNRTKINDYDTNPSPQNLTDLRTIKSGRKYQIGVVFEDIYGRQSPVYTSDDGVYRKSFDTYNGTGKQLNVELTTMPTNVDGRLHKYRFFIKESSEEYYNFIIDAVYDDEENEEHVWLVIPTYEINKIKEDDTIILKKLQNGNSPIGTYTSDELKYKVLDISGDKPDNITSVNTFDGKFFVKIKANAASTLLKQSIGTGGADGVIDDADFNYNSSTPSNLSSYLFLGEADEPNQTSKETYLFKDGQIHYYPSANYGTSLLTSNAGSVTTNPTTACGSITGTWQQLTTPNINGFSDSTGVINQIWAELDGNGFPRQFYICYTNGVTATNATPAVFETVPDETVLDIYYETEDSYLLSSGGAKTLRWYNAFDFGDGVESNRIKDDYNEDIIDKQVRVSAPSVIPFNEITKKTGLIYSGIYNSRTNINYLNQFPPAGGNTKDINPDYGSIQLLFAKTTDLIALCEDKIVSIQAQRDLLFNADGTTNLVATAKILGSAAPYSGDYGISKNPESFAFDGNRLYWADSSRNCVLRLSKNGITVISSKGMKSWFRDKFNQHPVNEQIFGVWDKYTDQYLITLDGETFSFKENVDGWVSRLSFEIENALSINGNLYAFNGGHIYQHHHPAALRNNFFGNQNGSSVKLIFNQEPSAIKNFKTIAYEGTQAKQGSTAGWDADVIETDQQDGQVLEFIEKEGKWFANIAGVEDIQASQYTNTDLGGLDSKEFAVQGLGNISGSAQITTTTTAAPTTTTTAPPTTTTTLTPTTTTTTAPVGDYTCNTQTWATATYNGATGAITVTPVLGSTTIHSYSPTTATPNTGNVQVTYTFSDSNPAWNNTGTQLTCTNALTVNTTYVTTTTTAVPTTAPPTTTTTAAPQPGATITGPTSSTIGQSITLIGEDDNFTGSTWSWTATSSPQGTSNANGFAVKQISFSESYAGNYTYQVTIDGTYTDTHNVTWQPAEYYTLQQCFTLNQGIITSQSTATLGTWNVGDRIKDNNTDMYYKVTGTTQVYQGVKLTNVTNTGQTNCPASPTYFYGLEHCITNTLYRSTQGSGSGLFSVNDIVESAGIQLRVISTNATVNQYTEFGVIQASAYTSCPLGSYDCNTYSDWVTLGWNSATGAITCTPTRSTTTVHSFSPTTATAGSGNVFVTFTFSDNNPNWDNTNSQIQCQNGASINTGTGGTTHYATYVTCGDPAGQIIFVESSSNIPSSSVISNGSDCFQWTNNGAGTPRQDISNYTLYNTYGTVGGNCTDCQNNLPTTTTTSTTAQTCFAVDVYWTTTDPATSTSASDDLCGNGSLRTIYTNGNGLANSTTVYSDSSCTSLASGTKYYTESPGGGTYYRWNGVTLTAITTVICP